MAESKFDASTGLTCISCRLVFFNSEIQRDHYKTEWHRYNVKRQVIFLNKSQFYIVTYRF